MEKIKNTKIRAFILLAFSFVFSISAFAASPEKLIPMGDTIGIELETEGIIIEDITEYESADGTKSSPAKEAGLQAGDVITHINDVPVNEAGDIKEQMSKCGGESVTVRIMRDGSEKQLTVTPVKNESGEYELGLWLRDNVLGLGTITYYDSQSGTYGALGHPISDGESETAIPIEGGDIYNAEITDITQGKSGSPGQIHGNIDSNAKIGTIEDNTMYGIYGQIEDTGFISSSDELEIASEDEIQLGKAEIISSVSGSKEKYDIEITRIYSDGDETGKTMMITVTDKDLIDITGGIVQGMSGSPIIQNGKLIGAVTHVLVNDSTKGYGTSIENMLEAAQLAA